MMTDLERRRVDLLEERVAYLEAFLRALAVGGTDATENGPQQPPTEALGIQLERSIERAHAGRFGKGGSR